MTKEAVWGAIASGALKAGLFAARTAGKGGRLWAKGIIAPVRSGTFGQRAFSVGTKAGTMGAAGYGTYKLNQRANLPTSGHDYTTFLRNNILAGKISPNELSPSDMESVRGLGLR